VRDAPPKSQCATSILFFCTPILIGGAGANAEEWERFIGGDAVKKAAIVYALLFAAWLLWSGGYSIPGSAHFHGLVLALGVVSCGAVLALHLRMEAQHTDRTSYVAALRFLTYVPWLLWQIVLSNLHVIRVILSPSLPIHPSVVRVRAPLRSDFVWTVFANSITLTPGTLTLDVDGGEALVHALTESTARDLESGAFARRVARLEARD